MGPAPVFGIINAIGCIIAISVGITLVNVVNGDAAVPAWAWAVAFFWAMMCSLAPWDKDDWS